MTQLAAATGRERVAQACVCCGHAPLQKSPAVLMPFLADRIFGWKPVVIDESWGLQTIRPGNAYSVCNSCFCPACGVLFLDMRFSDREMQALYQGYRDEEYTRLRDVYEPGYAERNRKFDGGVDYVAKVEAFLAPLLPARPRVLDWGGDTGRNTPFRGRSATHDVYDISEQPVVAGARRVSREEAIAGEYDLVSCSNVIEHVPFPEDTLLDLRAAMREDTVLYVEVPSEDLMRDCPDEPHLRKKHWHEHINFFSRRSLQALLARCGFEVVAEDELLVTTAGKTSWLFQLACRLAR